MTVIFLTSQRWKGRWRFARKWLVSCGILLWCFRNLKVLSLFLRKFSKMFQSGKSRPLPSAHPRCQPLRTHLPFSPRHLCTPTCLHRRPQTLCHSIWKDFYGSLLERTFLLTMNLVTLENNEQQLLNNSKYQSLFKYPD